MVLPTPNPLRVRLQVLRNFHTPVLRAGEDRLREAMADYAKSVLGAGERDGAFRTTFAASGR